MIVSNVQPNFIPILNVYPQSAYPQFIPTIVGPVFPFNFVPQIPNQNYPSYTTQQGEENSPVPPGLLSESQGFSGQNLQMFPQNKQNVKTVYDGFSPIMTHLNQSHAETQDAEFLSLSNSVYNSVWGEKTQMENINLTEISIFKNGKILQEEWMELILGFIEQETKTFQHEVIILKNLLQNISQESRFLKYYESNVLRNNYNDSRNKELFNEDFNLKKVCESKESQKDLQIQKIAVESSLNYSIQENPKLSEENKEETEKTYVQTRADKIESEDGTKEGDEMNITENNFVIDQKKDKKLTDQTSEPRTEDKLLENYQEVLNKDEENIKSREILCLNEHIEDIIRVEEIQDALSRMDLSPHKHTDEKDNDIGNSSSEDPNKTKENTSDDNQISSNLQSEKRIKKKANKKTKKKKSKNEKKQEQSDPLKDTTENQQQADYWKKEENLWKYMEKEAEKHHVEIPQRTFSDDQTTRNSSKQTLSNERVSERSKNKLNRIEFDHSDEENFIFPGKKEDNEKENQMDLYLKYKALYENPFREKIAGNKHTSSLLPKEKDKISMDKRLESIEKMFESMEKDTNQNVNLEEDDECKDQLKPNQKLSKCQKKKLRKKRKQGLLNLNEHIELPQPVPEVDNNYLAMLSSVLAEDPFALVKLKELILAQNNNGDFVELGFTEEELQEIEEVNFELEKTMKRTYNLTSCEYENNEKISSHDDDSIPEKRSQQESSSEGTGYSMPFPDNLDNRIIDPIDDEPNALESALSTISYLEELMKNRADFYAEIGGAGKGGSFWN